MSVAGRRAEILWRSGNLTGKDRQITYDTVVVRLGWFAPLSLGETVHIWDIPMTRFGGPCKAIRLRADPAFKRRIFTYNWAAVFAFIFLIGSPFLWAQVHPIPGAILLLAGLGLAVWAFVASRDDPRHRSIRLLLGLHEWGSSDPATWSKKILKDVVDPQEAFGAPSFAIRARKSLKKKRWAEAMWAARLATALEDEDEGEAITDEILDDPDVSDRLYTVARDPAARKQEFGKGPRLDQWLECEPEKHIFGVE
ncbi:MAG: hypothetical protein FJ271_20205 [Planctomycetes bacterium]|nr:hypothetical protein [Planctomycetota bacterium]